MQSQIYRNDSKKTIHQIPFNDEWTHSIYKLEESITLKLGMGLTLVHSERPKLFGVLAILSALGLSSDIINGNITVLV